MKTSHLAAASAAVFGLCALFSVSAHAQGNSGNSSSSTAIPSIPVGELSAYPTIVQTGTKPTLTWAITHPAKISNMVTINPPGTLIPNTTCYVSVQPIGTGVSACDPSQGTTPLYTEARLSLNGAPYQQLFYGIQTDVNPAYSLYIKKVFANNTIDFGGRFVKNGAWSPFYTTRSANMQVIALANGSTIPTYFPLYLSSKLASYLRPYLDASGKVKIGPLSVIILMELGNTNKAVDCFDYQDMVLLVTFSTKHPNNGHGNNLDGVDSSNPGRGSGGPNGQIDPSGGVDDEIR